MDFIDECDQMIITMIQRQLSVQCQSAFCCETIQTNCQGVQLQVIEPVIGMLFIE